MNFINKLERRYGRYAIKNLMKYVVILYVIGLFISMMPYQVYGYLRLDFTKIFKGQIWRLVTFVIPMVDVGYFLLKIISVYVYYIIGNALENAWGSFRLNLYFCWAFIQCNWSVYHLSFNRDNGVGICGFH